MSNISVFGTRPAFYNKQKHFSTNQCEATFKLPVHIIQHIQQLCQKSAKQITNSVLDKWSAISWE